MEPNYATGKTGTPLDLFTFHAKGTPTYTNGHVRMGIANQLRTDDDGFRIVASFPELKTTPVVIGECDPVRLRPPRLPRAVACLSNGTMYSSYTAASFARIHDWRNEHGVNLEGRAHVAFEFEASLTLPGSARSRATHRQTRAQCFRLFSKYERPAA